MGVYCPVPVAEVMNLTDRLRTLTDALPDSASVTLPVAVVREWLEEAGEPCSSTAGRIEPPTPQSWRERLWTCDADVRLGVRELAEALDRSADWVYRAASAKQAKAKGREPLPCTRLDGHLLFRTGAVRQWLEHSATTINPERGRLRAS